MNLYEDIDRRFSAISDDELLKLMEKSDFDRYNAIDTVFSLPSLVVPGDPFSAFCIALNGFQLSPKAWVEGVERPLTATSSVVSAGSYEEMPLAA
jgi:hypothetical protein